MDLLFPYAVVLYFVRNDDEMCGGTVHKVKELWNYTISKVRSYLVPYIIFAFIFSSSDSIYRTLIAMYGSRDALVMAETRTALWFLPACFCASLIYKACLLIFVKVKEEIMDASLFVVGIILSWLCSRIDIGIGYPLSINISMMAISFIAIGRLTRKWCMNLVKKPKRLMATVALICGIISVIYV